MVRNFYDSSSPSTLHQVDRSIYMALKRALARIGWSSEVQTYTDLTIPAPAGVVITLPGNKEYMITITEIVKKDE